MIDSLVRWVRDFGIDGFRCDVTAGVPVDFWAALEFGDKGAFAASVLNFTLAYEEVVGKRIPLAPLGQ
jgi:glycosidase